MGDKELHDGVDKLDLPSIDEKGILEEVENQLLGTLTQLKTGLNINDEKIVNLETQSAQLAKNLADEEQRVTESLDKLSANVSQLAKQQKADKEVAVNSDKLAEALAQLRDEIFAKISQTVSSLNGTIADLSNQLASTKKSVDELEGRLAAQKNATTQALGEFVKHDELPAPQTIDLSEYAKKSDIPPIPHPLYLSVFAKQ